MKYMTDLERSYGAKAKSPAFILHGDPDFDELSSVSKSEEDFKADNFESCYQLLMEFPGANSIYLFSSPSEEHFHSEDVLSFLGSS